MQGVAWRSLGKILTPGDYPRLVEIERQHQSDEDRVCAVIECWLQGDEEPSWRRIILALDDTNETGAADRIRHLAEALPGKSCNSMTFMYSV